MTRSGWLAVMTLAAALAVAGAAQAEGGNGKGNKAKKGKQAQGSTATVHRSKGPDGISLIAANYSRGRDEKNVTAILWAAANIIPRIPLSLA